MTSSRKDPPMKLVIKSELGILSTRAILEDAPRIVAWGISKGLLSRPGFIRTPTDPAEVRRRVLASVFSNLQ